MPRSVSRFCCDDCDTSRRPWTVLELEQLQRGYADGLTIRELDASFLHVSSSGRVSRRAVTTKLYSLIARGDVVHQVRSRRPKTSASLAA